jgi:hypothetical protein
VIEEIKDIAEIVLYFKHRSLIGQIGRIGFFKIQIWISGLM